MTTNEMKWTPGPWKAERVGASEIEIGAETPRGHLSVAWVHLGAKPKEAEVADGMRDARFIALAPEMAETIRRAARDLRLLLAVPKGERDAADIDDQTRSELEAMSSSLDAALAKAEGR